MYSDLIKFIKMTNLKLSKEPNLLGLINMVQIL